MKDIILLENETIQKNDLFVIEIKKGKHTYVQEKSIFLYDNRMFRKDRDNTIKIFEADKIKIDGNIKLIHSKQLGGWFAADLCIKVKLKD